MTAEDIHREESAPRIVSLPEHLADEFVDGTLEQIEQISIATSPLAFEGRGIIYTERSERVPGLQGEIHLRVRYATLGRTSKMYFEYIAVNQELYEEVDCASVVLQRLSVDEYLVEHRYVDPEVGRRQGVGSQLYLQAEDWAKQIAQRIKKPITLTAGISQYDVLKWFTKHGYTPDEKSRSLYQDVMDNVGLTDKYNVEDGNSGDRYAPSTIRGKTLEGHWRADPVRITMRKVLQPGN